MKSKVITLKAKDHDKAGLSQYPNAGPYPSIFGMRKLYGYGENEHTIIRCGRYIYNVPNVDIPEILRKVGM